MQECSQQNNNQRNANYSMKCKTNPINNKQQLLELNIKNIDTLKNPNMLTEKNKLIGLKVSQNEINDHTKMLQKLQKNV